MITHDMGDAIPPANKTPRVVEWTSKQRGCEPTTRTMMLPVGMAVRASLRDAYWCSRKMHEEFAAACRANNVALPALFVIVLSDEVIGGGTYANEDARDRAFTDCVILEAEWEFRGGGKLPMIGTDLSGIPDEQQIEIARRTGAPTRIMATKQ
jgi:hypothetical protein